LEIIVTGRHIEITAALKNYIEKKLSKIEKYFKDKSLIVNVTLFIERSCHQIEVSLLSSGQVVNGKVSSNDMYLSIDKVVLKLESQLKKQKEKQKINLPNKEAVLETFSSQGEATCRVIKTKKFATKPMPLDEAIIQLNLSKEVFFVFLNSKTNQVNVIYHRRDKNLGLIEPVFE